MSRRVKPVQDQKMKRRRAVIVGSSSDCVEKVARGSECSVSWKTSIDGSDSS
jgi:hypothetical protein